MKVAFSLLLVLDHQPPFGLRHGSQSQLCEGVAMDGLDVGDGQMALDRVFSLYVSYLPQLSTGRWGADPAAHLKKQATTRCHGACVMTEDLVRGHDVVWRRERRSGGERWLKEWL